MGVKNKIRFTIFFLLFSLDLKIKNNMADIEKVKTGTITEYLNDSADANMQPIINGPTAELENIRGMRSDK